MNKIILPGLSCLALSGCFDNSAPIHPLTTSKNNPPIIAMIPTLDAVSGQTKSFQIEASDQDEDVLTYSLIEAPKWMSIDAQTGRLTLTPEKENAGSQTVKVRVSDGSLFQEAEMMILVSLTMTPVDPDLINHAPVISPLSAINIYADQTTWVQIKASDQDDDVLTYSLIEAPKWMSIDAQTGRLTLTPEKENAGSQTVKVRVSDGSLFQEAEMMILVSLTMTPVDPDLINHAPVISPLSPINIYADQTTWVQIKASDPDGDVLTYSLVDAPTWISVDSKTGRITLSPKNNNAGPHKLKIRVSDKGLFHEVTVDVNVTSLEVPLVLEANLAEDNRRKITFNWNSDPRATTYQLYRNGEPYRRLFNSPVTDNASGAGQTYSFTVAPCEGAGNMEDVCSIVQSNPYNVTIETDKLFVDFNGLDTSNNQTVSAVIIGRRPDGALQSDVMYFNNNEPKHVKTLFHSGTYFGYQTSPPPSGQHCEIETLNRRNSNGVDVTLHYSCLTPSLLEAKTNKIDIQMGSTGQVGSRLELRRKSDNALITTSAYHYESSDNNIVTINENGLLNGVSNGTATITVTADPEFYGDGLTVSYSVEVTKETHYVLNKIDLGQQLLLPSDNRHHVMASEADFTVRGYPLARSLDNITKPNLSFIVENKNTVKTYPVFCPESLSTELPTNEDYALESSCYAHVPGELVKSDSRFYFSDIDSGAKFSVNAKVNNRNHLKLVIVPLVANDRVPDMPSVEEIRARVLKTMPFATVDVRFREPYIYPDPVPTYNLRPFLDTVDTIRINEDNSGTHYMGIVKGECGPNGLAYVGERHTAAIKDSDCGPPNYSLHFGMMHELGHNFSLKHAPCGGPSNPDEFFSQEPQPWVGANQGHMSPAPLYSLVDKRILPPTLSYTKEDLMGYCSGTHLSEYHHAKMAAYIEQRSTYDKPNENEIQDLTPLELATIISGQIAEDGSVRFDPVSAGYVALHVNKPSHYRLTVSGKETYSLDTVEDSNEKILYFNIAIPYTNEITSLELSTPQGTLIKKVHSPSNNARMSAFSPLIELSENYIDLKWDKTLYPWVTVIVTSPEGNRTLLIDKAKNGDLALQIPKKNYKGSVTLIFSNGENTKVVTSKLE